ncbi:hypothetical protein N9L68_06145 [bacterium]|nr:hypothetical protein [bacterium]
MGRGIQGRPPAGQGRRDEAMPWHAPRHAAEGLGAGTVATGQGLARHLDGATRKGWHRWSLVDATWNKEREEERRSLGEGAIPRTGAGESWPRT